MSILLSTFAMPENAINLKFGDVDADGVVEMIVMTKDDLTQTPAGITLYCYEINSDGSVVEDVVIPLGQKAVYFDVEDGLWGMDGYGLVDLYHGVRIVEQSTWLKSLGATSPKQLEIAQDWDGDGTVELMVNSRGKIQVYSKDGRAWGEVSSATSGSIRDNTKSGGIVMEVAQRSLPYVVQDVDGDTVNDLLLLDGNKAKVYFSQPGQIGVSSATLSLPLNVQPQEQREQRKELGKIQFADINADGKVDVLWQYWVTDGSWFGATAEIHWAYGTGSGFEPVKKLYSDSAVFDVRLEDIDNDGDLDLMLLETDLGWGSITKALVSRTGTLDLQLHVQDGKTFTKSESSLGTFEVPIESSNAFDYSARLDINADGKRDVISMQGSMLHILTSTPSGYQQTLSQEMGLRGDLFLACTPECRTDFLVIWPVEAAEAALVRFQ